MASDPRLEKLRKIITESLRVQRDSETIEYVNVGTAAQDAGSKQNHAIFARRGCGKTLLLHYSSKSLNSDMRSIYLNCEDFKRHSFPNVLIEILKSIFTELNKNLYGWFGKKKKSKDIIKDIISKLEILQKRSDIHDEEIRAKNANALSQSLDLSGGISADGASLKVGAKGEVKENSEIERSYKIHKDKLQELDMWLPELKANIRSFFEVSSNIKAIIIQIDDLYHLKRADQAFIVDYIHRLCKDVPLYFKIATLRHASTLYLDRDGQPIGAQERHDYQPIDIDYTFRNFKKTSDQNWQIIVQFGKKAGLGEKEMNALFKGEGFNRLVMAGGGVPRDVLSLFLEVLSEKSGEDQRIGKDDVRNLSRSNFEHRIEELKQDSKIDEQGDLLKGIYIIRSFCLERKSNIFVVEEKMLQKNDQWRNLIYRLLDYRIIHHCGAALTHKSQEGTFQAFAIDIGCYAHFRKLDGKFNEIDVSDGSAKEKMRSAPVLDEAKIADLFKTVPEDVESVLLPSESD